MKLTAFLPLFLFAGSVLSQERHDSPEANQVPLSESREVRLLSALRQALLQADEHATTLALAVENFNNEVSVGETWGTNPYKFDISYYHAAVKPAILREFRGHNGNGDFLFQLNGKERRLNFKVCGTNPDFEVDKTGDVWPNAVKDQDGHCKMNIFTLNLGGLLKKLKEDE